MYIGIETGGTKVVCAAAPSPDDIVLERTVATTTPSQTLAHVVGFIAEVRRRSPLAGVGIAAFGPLDLDESSPTFGHVRVTPKPGWSGTDLVSPVRTAAGCPVAIETDVTAAAVAEHRIGAGQGLADLAYVTVGTGIGVGAIVAGRPLHGTAHPEAGHISVRPHPDDTFAGVCRLHGHCLEGLASGPALQARWTSASTSPADLPDAARRMQAYYLAQLVTTLLYVLSPARVVIGGGVLAMPGLLDDIRTQTARLLNGALADHPAARPDSGFIVPPSLGPRAGVVGALAIAVERTTRAG